MRSFGVSAGMRVVISIVSFGIQSGPAMRAGRHYTAYRPSESRVADTVFRRPHMRTAGTAVVIRSDCVYDNGRRAGVAQSVEQRIRNAKVGGSIPFSGTRLDKERSSENLVFVFSDDLFYCGVCSRLRT